MSLAMPRYLPGRPGRQFSADLYQDLKWQNVFYIRIPNNLGVADFCWWPKEPGYENPRLAHYTGYAEVTSFAGWRKA